MRALLDRRFLGALILLIANDRWFKAQWPGFVTGKLSDVVGPVVAAVLGAVMLERLVGERGQKLHVPIACGAVGILMLTIKTSAAGAGFVESVLGLSGTAQSIVVDPTDLIGLAALAVVPAIVRDPRPIAESETVKMVVLATGAFACVATSETQNPDYDAIAVQGDTITILESTLEESGRLVSIDGGETWTYESFFEPSSVAEGSEGIPVELNTAQSLCLSNDESICVRSAEGFALDESRDGGRTWERVYEVEPGAHLARQTFSEFADLTQGAGALAELEDGSVVAIMGQLQPAVRSPDGEWSPDVGSYRTPGPFVVAVVMLGAIVLTSGAILFAVRRQVVGILTVIGALPIGLFAWSMWFINDTLGLLVVSFGAVSLGVLALAAIGYVVSILSRNRKHPFSPRALAMFATPVLSAFLVVIPIVAWRFGIGTSLSAGLGAFVIACAAAIGFAVTAKRIDGPVPSPPPPRLPPAPMRTPPPSR